MQKKATRIRWLKRAEKDIHRHFDHAAQHSRKLASTILFLAEQINQLLAEMPHIGSPLHEFQSRLVRRWLIDDYEIRYEIRPREIVILRVFHTREDR